MASEAAPRRSKEPTKSCMIVGISGPSSSGKSTIARHLRGIWKDSFILHQDDFFLPESRLPTRAGHLDWDSAESLDLPALRKALEYIKSHGASPEWLNSKEDQNDLGPSSIDAEVIKVCEEQVKQGLERFGGKWDRICFVDGFLLYCPESVWEKTSDLLDLKIFLPATFEDVKTRRERRSGYVTLEGFWKDPEGYVEDVVWPNYVESHKRLFVDEDVTKGISEKMSNALGIFAWNGHPAPFQGDLNNCLAWVVDLLCQYQFGTDGLRGEG